MIRVASLILTMSPCIIVADRAGGVFEGIPGGGEQLSVRIQEMMVLVCCIVATYVLTCVASASWTQC